MPAQVVQPSWPGIPAIRSESLSRLVAGTCPAMTVGRPSVHRDFRSRKSCGELLFVTLHLFIIIGAVAVADALVHGERRGITLGGRRVDQVEMA